jgi:TonB family protein
VTNLRVAGTPRTALEIAARNAAGQWEFAPTFLNDQPIPVAMTVTLNFSAERRLVEEVFRVGTSADIREPKKIKDVPAVYPRDALAKRQGGMVVLEAVINPLGKVTDLRVVRGVNDAFDQAAIAAVRQWEFIPTHVAGIPVTVAMTVAVTFNAR